MLFGVVSGIGRGMVVLDGEWGRPKNGCTGRGPHLWQGRGGPK